MKKAIVFTSVLVLILGLGIVAYADSAKDTPPWFHDMMDWRREQVQEAVGAGEITAEEAEDFQVRLERMETFHLENGFGVGMMGGNAPCHRSDGRRGLGQRIGRGMRGMMGGF